MMEVYLATDHAGFALKEAVKKHLGAKDDIKVIDCGADVFDKDDDYPDIIAKAALGVLHAKDPDNTRGIIFGGSGQGEANAAIAVGVRTIVFYGPRLPVGAADADGRESSNPYEIVELGRKHNDARILSLGARFLHEKEAFQAVDIFLTTEFAGGRHGRRVEQLERLRHA